MNGVGSQTPFSKRLVLSYLIDWILILATVGVGGAFSKIKGNRHAFSLNDLAISYPYHPDTVTVGVLLVVSLVAPGVITALVCLLFIPGPAASRSVPKALVWRRKLWEWNAAWMGLGVALAGTFMVTEGLKDLAGKPRPDLLQRCNPDLSKVDQYHISGPGLVYPNANVIVDWHICQQTDAAMLSDGFASWPSGHSSFSWAGMLYLTLFLCAKFAIAVPFLPQTSYARCRSSTESTFGGKSKSETMPQNQAAAPPVYLLILAFVPIGTASFICVSRYVDYRHAGFDIISGALIGAFFAYFGFRLYHLPIRRGAGWPWAARSRGRAFWLPVGTPSYVGDGEWESADEARHDVESAPSTEVPTMSEQ